VVGVATSYGLGGPRFEFQKAKETFSTPKPYRPALGPTQPPIRWVPGLFPRGKAAWREADHLTPSSADVKNEWSCTSAALRSLLTSTWTTVLLLRSRHVGMLQTIIKFTCNRFYVI
jgi:hypothetical protein